LPEACIANGREFLADLLSGSDRRSPLADPVSEHLQELCSAISGEE
jgi:hypothetical protein